MVWAELIWYRIGTSGWLLKTWCWTSEWNMLCEWLLASEERLYCKMASVIGLSVVSDHCSHLYMNQRFLSKQCFYITSSEIVLCCGTLSVCPHVNLQLVIWVCRTSCREQPACALIHTSCRFWSNSIWVSFLFIPPPSLPALGCIYFPLFLLCQVPAQCLCFSHQCEEAQTELSNVNMLHTAQAYSEWTLSLWSRQTYI